MEKSYKIRLIRHLTFLREELEDYETFKNLTKEEYNAEKNKRRNVERWIENIINSSIDIAKTILSTENIAIPDTYREAILSLSLVSDFDKDEIKQLSDWVRLRNIISHEYLDIRWNSINMFINQAIPIYRNFVEKVKDYIDKNP